MCLNKITKIKTKESNKMNCPNCNRKAYSICGNKKCVCFISIPVGEKPLIQLWKFYNITIPRWLGCIIWKVSYFIKLHPTKYMFELERCPWCGFTKNMNFWFDEECNQVIKAAGVSSFRELYNKTVY